MVRHLLRSWLNALAKRGGYVPTVDLNAARAEAKSWADEAEGLRRDLADYVRGWPPGHFYSPIPDLAEVDRRADQIFTSPRELPGIDLNEAEQLATLAQLGEFHKEHPFPMERRDDFRYFVDNPNYGYGDAVVLYGMIRHVRPSRVVEVGSGYSSCVVLDTNERFLGGQTKCTFIEPNPELFLGLLREGDAEKITILQSPLQDVPDAVFADLQAGDILLIDSTHVSKVDSDVNHLFFRVLPSLQPGVLVHIHDVYYPLEYPRSWVFEGRAWNEAYVLRAFLQFNSAFSIVLFSQFLHALHGAAWSAALSEHAGNASSIWLRKR